MISDKYRLSCYSLFLG